MCWINCSRKNKFLEISFFWYNFSLTLLRNPDGEPFSSISFKPCLHRPLSPRFERRETKYVERGVRSWERAFESDRLKAEPSAAGGAAMQSKIRARREVTGGREGYLPTCIQRNCRRIPHFKQPAKPWILVSISTASFYQARLIDPIEVALICPWQKHLLMSQYFILRVHEKTLVQRVKSGIGTYRTWSLVLDTVRIVIEGVCVCCGSREICLQIWARRRPPLHFFHRSFIGKNCRSDEERGLATICSEAISRRRKKIGLLDCRLLAITLQFNQSWLIKSSFFTYVRSSFVIALLTAVITRQNFVPSSKRAL